MKRRGFTLTEVVMAVTLLILGALVLMELLPTTYLSARAGEQQAQAAQVAQNTLELYRADPRNCSDLLCAPTSASGTVFQPKLTIADAGPHVKRLKVKISWRSSKNRELWVEREVEVCVLPR